MVKVPQDRTVYQPATAFCRNPQCREQSNEEFEFNVDHDNFSCPKCGANKSPMVGLKVLTHLLIPNPAGPIIGTGGIRFALGCDLKRAYLATTSNLEAATDNPEIANCPGCLERARSLGYTPQVWAPQVITPVFTSTQNEASTP